MRSVTVGAIRHDALTAQKKSVGYEPADFSFDWPQLLVRRQLHGKRCLFMHDRNCSRRRRASIQSRMRGLSTLPQRRRSVICSTLMQRAEVDIATAMIDLCGHGCERGQIVRVGRMVIRLSRRGAKRGIQINFDKGTGGAIGVSEAAGARDVLSVNRSAARRRRQTDTGDAKIAELRQLARFADAIVVGILPDHEVTERLILAVDHAVMVAVEARKCGDAVGEVARH